MKNVQKFSILLLFSIILGACSLLEPTLLTLGSAIVSNNADGTKTVTVPYALFYDKGNNSLQCHWYQSGDPKPTDQTIPIQNPSQATGKVTMVTKLTSGTLKYLCSYANGNHGATANGTVDLNGSNKPPTPTSRTTAPAPSGKDLTGTQWIFNMTIGGGGIQLGYGGWLFTQGKIGQEVTVCYSGPTAGKCNDSGPTTFSHGDGNFDGTTLHLTLRAPSNDVSHYGEVSITATLNADGTKLDGTDTPASGIKGGAFNAYKTADGLGH